MFWSDRYAIAIFFNHDLSTDIETKVWGKPNGSTIATFENLGIDCVHL